MKSRVTWMDKGLFMRAHAAVLVTVFVVSFLLSWPGIGGYWPFLLIAFVPLFILQEQCLSGLITKQAFHWFLFVAFFAANTGALYFLFFIEGHFGIRILSLLTPVMVNSLWMTGVFSIFHRIRWKRKGSIATVVLVALWMAAEWATHHWVLAFPWLTLGNVLGPHPADAQWYAYTGVAGGTLWVWLVNIFCFQAISKGQRVVYWLIAAVLLVFIPTWSSRTTLETPVKKADELKWTIVQPCLDNYSEKFESDEYARNIDRAFSLVENNNDWGNTLVFPETFLFEPGVISGQKDQLKFRGLWMHDIGRSKSVELLAHHLANLPAASIISGAFVTRYYPEKGRAPSFARQINGLEGAAVHYNAAVIIDSSEIRIRQKGVLVAGVEYIPFSEYLPILNNWALDLGGIVGTLGQPDTIAPVGVAGVDVGVEICYDSAFGWLSRKLASDGARALVILTNDSWWGQTPGHLQLLSFAQLRAIETGMPVIRAANNGVSAFIDNRGFIVSSIPWNRRAALTQVVRFSEGQTFYTRWGDYLYLLSVAVLILAVPFAVRGNRMRSGLHGFH